MLTSDCSINRIAAFLFTINRIYKKDLFIPDAWFNFITLHNINLPTVDKKNYVPSGQDKCLGFKIKSLAPKIDILPLNNCITSLNNLLNKHQKTSGG